MLTDITGRKQTEEALKHSQTRLESAQAQARIRSLEYDPLTGNIFWLRQMHVLCGLDPEIGLRQNGAGLRVRTSLLMSPGTRIDIGVGPRFVNRRRLHPRNFRAFACQCKSAGVPTRFHIAPQCSSPNAESDADSTTIADDCRFDVTWNRFIAGLHYRTSRTNTNPPHAVTYVRPFESPLEPTLFDGALFATLSG